MKRSDMSVFVQLVFLSCVLICFIEFVFGASSVNLQKSKDLTCKHTIRVVFTSDSWKKQIGGNSSPHYINQDQFFVAVIEKIVSTAGGTKIINHEALFGFHEENFTPKILKNLTHNSLVKLN